MSLYHSAKGSVNYTIVGNPTIVDGVASGFSSSSYLSVNIGSWDIVNNVYEVGLSLPNIVRSVSPLYMCGMWLTLAQDGKISIQGPKTGGGNGFFATTSNSFANGDNVKLKIKYSLDNLEIKMSVNGEDYGNSQTYSDVPSVTSGLSITTIGTYSIFTYQGSIDLNDSYITINGQPWFGVCPIEVKKHQLMGPVGYTVTGSPTITDGEASGFSNNAYVKCAQNMPTSFNTLEVQCKVKLTDSSISTQQYAFFTNFNMAFSFRGGNRVYVLVGGKTGGGFWEMYPEFTLDFNTWYWLKLNAANNVYTLSYSLNGVNFTQIATLSPTETPILSDNLTCFGTSNREPVKYLHGSIDLNGTYIKVNGSLWYYQPAPTKYIQKDNKLVYADPGLYLAGPVNYTVMGSPVVEDGVMSSITRNDTVSVRNFQISATNWEFVVKANRLQSNGGMLYAFTNGQKLYLNMSNTRIKAHLSDTDIEINTSVSADTFYYIRVRKSASTTYLDYSLDGTTWQGEVSGTADFSGVSDGAINFGQAAYYSSNAFPGSIDLKETYIKVNDQLWFYGKNYASLNIAPVPSGYTYGTTTTNAIGYVDMRTQAFTAAPSGATIGRDE